MYRQNFRIIFFFNEAKNAGIAYVLARIFNEIGGKKKLKFPINNCGLVLTCSINQHEVTGLRSVEIRLFFWQEMVCD